LLRQFVDMFSLAREVKLIKAFGVSVILFVVLVLPVKASFTGLDAIPYDADTHYFSVEGTDEGENCYFYVASDIDGPVDAGFYGEPCMWNIYNFSSACSYTQTLLSYSTNVFHYEVRTGTDATDAMDNPAEASGYYDCDNLTWEQDFPVIPPESTTSTSSTVEVTGPYTGSIFLVFLIGSMTTVAIVGIGVTAMLFVAWFFAVKLFKR